MKTKFIILVIAILFLLPVMSAAVLWESDWSNSTGNSSDALLDGGEWDSIMDNNDVLYVVDSSGLGFPAGMQNVLRWSIPQGSAGKMVHVEGNWAAPSVGDSLYYRWYHLSTVADGEPAGGMQMHWLQASSLAWLFLSRAPSTARQLMSLDVLLNYPDNRFYWQNTSSIAQQLTNQVYRFEMKLLRTSSTQGNVSLRVYDGNNNLIADSDDWLNDNLNSLTNRNIIINLSDADYHTFEIGNNDVNAASAATGYMYAGGFAVCDTTWCGAYGAAASSNPADLNTDDKVDFSDILIIIRRILGLNSNSAADMNNDGAVNIFDLVNASRLFGKQYGTDTTAPTITSSRPVNNTNLSAGTTSVVLFAETNERATCRYLNTTSGSFATMNNFTRSGRVSHSIQLTGLQDGTTYNYYIQCQDEAGNLNSTDYNIRFGVNGTGGGSDEPQAPATEILMQDFTPGGLDGGGVYLYESYDRYSDNGNDISLMLNDDTHYGTASSGKRTTILFTTGQSLVVGRGDSGLAARSQYAAADTARIWYTPSYSASLGSYTGAIVFQFYVRFPDASGFVDSEGMKFFELWYTSSSRIQLGMRNGGRNFAFNPGNTNAGSAPYGGEIGAQPIGPYPSSLNDGNWHRVTIIYRPHTTVASGWNGTLFTTPSSRDGYAKAWIDGTKIVDVSEATRGVTPDGGTRNWNDANGAELDALGAGSNYYIQRGQYPEYLNGLTGLFNLDNDDLKIWVIP